jgi:hypothetical protein
MSVDQMGRAWIKELETEKKILDLLDSSPEPRLDHGDIKDKTGLSPKTIDKTINRLVNESKIVKIPSNSYKTSKPYVSTKRIESSLSNIYQDYQDKLLDIGRYLEETERDVIDLKSQYINKIKEKYQQISPQVSQQEKDLLVSELGKELYSAMDGLDDALSRKADLETRKEKLGPTCLVCKFGKRNRSTKKNEIWCTYDMSGLRVYHDKSYSCENFKLK